MGEKPVVLVVEDEFLVRIAAVDLVEDAGFRALEAGTADEAIAILEQRQDIRLVFSDVDMPGSMDGIKLAHYIRNRWPPIFLLLTSGKAVVEEAQLPVGARFFSKPYESPAITKTIASMLGGR